PLQIYVYAISPYDEWHRLAWAGSLVLIVLIMVSVTLVRIYAARGMMKRASGCRHRCGAPECVVRADAHAAGHQREAAGQPRDGADRSFRVRQEHVCALPEPYA